MKEQRRSTLKKLIASIGAFTGLGIATKAKADVAPEKEVFNVVKDDQDVPLFSGSTKFGNLVFIAGKGAHFDGDITAHTKHVLDELEKELGDDHYRLIEELRTIKELCHTTQTRLPFQFYIH